ncbi:MAG: small-conductance mechanosensitive channel [Bradymonadia bacterium]|jgi:small-conductance mechanosensitive channel
MSLLLADATISERATDGLIALGVLIIGLMIARALSTLAGRLPRVRKSAQNAMIVRRFVFYALSLVVFGAALHQLGVDPSVLLGTAGIMTVAIGFASQTSTSNLVAGLFLLFERPFVVGDVIRVGTDQGEVLSVDMLSVKLRTYDNLLVRVPNETLLRSEIANLTHFPIRRLDIILQVSYGEDMTAFREALVSVARAIPLALDEPAPCVFITEFRESSVALQFSVWGARETFIDLGTALFDELQHDIYQGRFQPAFPVRQMIDRSEDEDEVDERRK